MNTLTIDIGHLFDDADENHFIQPQEFDALISQYQAAFLKVQESLRTGESRITRPIVPAPALAEIKELAASIRSRYEAVLIIGIGGSSLGFEAALQFLKCPYYNLSAQKQGSPRMFVVDNVDPAVTTQLDELLDFSKTAIIYISKSGATPESAANFIHFYAKYKEAGGADEDIVVICDNKENSLNRIAKQLGCHLLHMPADLGGRYSVLSSVGLLPCEIAGIDSSALIAGATEMHNAIVNTQPADNGVFVLAACLAGLEKKGKSIHVLFSYGTILAKIGLWFTQLWAESLGKELSLSGEKVNAGTTPLPALGAVDQHSILQLFKEGPHDKVFSFLTVQEMPHKVELPSVFSDERDYAYFAGHTFAEQLQIEQVSTEVALVSAQRPCCRITMPEVSPAALGALFYFWEAVVVATAEFGQIDPFDQPGVEQGKNMTYALMGRSDFIPERSKVEEQLKAFDRKRRLFSL